MSNGTKAAVDLGNPDLKPIGVQFWRGTRSRVLLLKSRMRRWFGMDPIETRCVRALSCLNFQSDRRDKNARLRAREDLARFELMLVSIWSQEII